MNDLMATPVGLPAVETSAAAAAAAAKAVVEARFIMAMRRPRNWDMVRQSLLHECKRPSFASDPSSLYRKPIGAGIEGLGVRFAELALRCMTNTMAESALIYSDDRMELHTVTVTDLESNICFSQQVTLQRTVERSRPASDGSYLSKRTNSNGQDVYTIMATEDDLANKRGAAISKAMRNCALRLIPGDLQSEAEDVIRSVRKDKAAADPDAERRRLIDAFARVGVRASDLTEYLGHDLGTTTPAELVDLRGLYGSLKDGEASWHSIMEAKYGPAEPKPGRKTRKSLDDASPTETGEWAIQESAVQSVDIDTETGEIIEPQAAPEPMPPSGAFLDWSAAIDDCQTKSDFARLVRRVRDDDRLSAEEHAELLELIGARQDVLKAGA